MEKKLTKLKKQGIINLICFMAELLIWPTIFNSCLNQGNIAHFLQKCLHFMSMDGLMLTSLTIFALSTSLRTLYATYINNQIDKVLLESEFASNNNDSPTKEVKLVNENEPRLQEKTPVTIIEKHNNLSLNHELLNANSNSDKIEDDTFNKQNEELTKPKTYVKMYKR